MFILVYIFLGKRSTSTTSDTVKEFPHRVHPLPYWVPHVPLFAGASALPSAAFRQVGYSFLWSGVVSWPFVDNWISWRLFTPFLPFFPSHTFFFPSFGLIHLQVNPANRQFTSSVPKQVRAQYKWWTMTLYDFIWLYHTIGLSLLFLKTKWCSVLSACAGCPGCRRSGAWEPASTASDGYTGHTSANLSHRFLGFWRFSMLLLLKISGCGQQVAATGGDAMSPRAWSTFFIRKCHRLFTDLIDSCIQQLWSTLKY